jgi:hypothetical protein
MGLEFQSQGLKINSYGMLAFETGIESVKGTRFEAVPVALTSLYLSVIKVSII